MRIALVMTILALTTACYGGAEPMPPKDSLLPQMLHPAYRDWVHRPGEMLSFWLWMGPDVMKDQIARTGANATSLHTTIRVVKDETSPVGARTVPADEQLGRRFDDLLRELKVDAGIDIGEHNNAWFVRYPDWFWELHPQAAMQDKDGRVIRAGNNPFPAIGDALLCELARRQMGDMARVLKDADRVRYWVLGGEQSYPDYFGLPEGDYRPDALKQYEAWQKLHGVTAKPGADKVLWRTFREAVLTDYYAGYTAFLRGQDDSRPIFISSHGNPFALDFRSRIGYPVADLAGVSDGFEAGPISIDDDPERLIRLTLDQQTSFGIPVTAPRLGNKQLDPTAQGGGRSFSLESLRRTVYEALGFGVWHLGLVSWAGKLPDGEWFIAGTPAEAECREVFAELKRAAPYLEGCSRLRPQVGIFISDATWRRRWQDRWTLLYDEAVKRGWHVMLITDAQIEPELARTTPVIISVDNPILTQRTRAGLSEYMKAGGTVVSVGSLGTDDGRGHKAASVPGVVHIPDDAPGAPAKISHRTQTPGGAATWSADVKPLPMDALEEAVSGKADIRPIRLTGPIECLPLTDGTNVIAVLINRSGEAQDMRLEPSVMIRSHLKRVQEELSPKDFAPVDRWETVDLVTGKLCKDEKVRLEPHGTALILLRPVVGAEDAASELRTAECVVEDWRTLGIDTSTYQSLLSHVQERIQEHDGFAITRMICHSLGMKTTAHCTDEMLRIQVKVWRPFDGQRASGAQVRVRLVPGPFEWYKLEETADGVYSLILPEEKLPRFYNPSTGKYELADGLTQLIFDASLRNLSGGARTTVRLR